MGGTGQEGAAENAAGATVVADVVDAGAGASERAAAELRGVQLSEEWREGEEGGSVAVGHWRWRGVLVQVRGGGKPLHHITCTALPVVPHSPSCSPPSESCAPVGVTPMGSISRLSCLAGPELVVLCDCRLQTAALWFVSV